MRRFMLALTALLFSVPLLAQTPGIQFTEGVHYRPIQPPQPTNDPAKIEVVEVFGYLCPHCANFQPFIDPWTEKIDEQVEFIRMPVIFQRSWEPFARAYYTAEALGVLDQSHTAVFNAIHNERKRLRSDEDLAEFFTQFGVSAEDYMKTAKSFAVETKLRRAVTLSQRYGVTGTPSIVVNGKYLAMARMAGGNNELIQLIDHLVEKEAAAMPAVEEDGEDAGDTSE